MNLQIHNRVASQQPPITTLCSLFGSNTIMSSPNRHQRSPSINKQPKKKMKCPKHKISQPKNMQAERRNVSPPVPYLAIMRSPQHFTNLQFKQQPRRQQFNITAGFQTRYKSPLNSLPTVQQKPQTHRNINQPIKNLPAPIISRSYLTKEKSPEIKIEFSKATTVNTQRTENTLKKYRSLDQFEPMTVRSLESSKTDSILEMKESEIMIDFFHPPFAMEQSKSIQFRRK